MNQKDPCQISIVPFSDMLESTEQGLVIPVNCVGVMGAGLALAFKQRYPQGYSSYVAHCDSGELSLGRVTTAVLNAGPPETLAFFVPTKDHWRNPSSLDIIGASLEALRVVLVARAAEHGPLESLAIPKLGCGLGQLKWHDVWPRIFAFLDLIDASIVKHAVIYGA